MTITTFSVPVDIPWRRLCVSDDMIDSTVCDRRFPYRWRSSIAVFGYEPPEDAQTYDDLVISYLKVACTITSFQPDATEVGLKDRRLDSYWDTPLLITDYANTVGRAYPCYGAVLEVAVAPSVITIDGQPVTLAQYPYFVEFDPKKRELYELVTDTGEQMSRSLDDVNVRKGATTTNSREVLDQTSVGLEADAGASIGVVSLGGKATYNNTSSTKNISQNEVQDVRTTDNAREQRENLSHTTQLSQMYQQLNSFHLGTNRSVFFVLPRPHIIDDPDTPLTFINGPRRLEGIQEFFLVVLRPKIIPDICVEAYLETAHVGEVTTYGAGVQRRDDVSPTLSVSIASNQNQPKTIRTKSGSITYKPPAGWLIDTAASGGYKVNISKQQGVTFCGVTEVDATHLVLKGDVKTSYTVDIDDGKPPTGRGETDKPHVAGVEGQDGYLEANSTVHLQRGVQVATGTANGLYITGRGVCCCQSGEVRGTSVLGRESVLFERRLTATVSASVGLTARMAATDANLLRAEIDQTIVQSMGAADRYPRGLVGFAESRFVAQSMAGLLAAAQADGDAPAEVRGLDSALAGRIAEAMPGVDRGALLMMSPAEQQDRFDLTDDELRHLRRALVGLEGEAPAPADRWTTPAERARATSVAVPLVRGLEEGAAAATLAAVGLSFGLERTIDSPLPPGTVIAQSPEAGEQVATGSDVSLTLASGCTVRLPDVVGRGLMEAACALCDAGLERDPAVHGDGALGARVTAIEPPAGSLVTPHAEVTLTLHCP